MDKHKFNRLHPAPHEDGRLRLYKFRSFDSDNPEFATDIFQHRQLYFALPNQLNDPWEGHANVLIPENDDEERAAFRRLVQTGIRGGLSSGEAEETAKNILSDPDKLQSTVRDSVTRVNQSLRICSFSAERDNNLLWAHYADSYRGFCIELSQQSRLYELSYRVNYQREYPSFKYPHSDYDALNTIVTKSEDWAYEKEYRAFEVPDTNVGLGLEDGKYRLEDNSIGAVYFAPLMPEDHQNTIIDAVVNGPFNPQLYQSKFRNDAFRLDFERLDGTR